MVGSDFKATKMKSTSGSDSSQGSKDFNHNSSPEKSFISLIEERESLKSQGLPYWYTDYIRSKKMQQIRCNTPSRTSDENSNYIVPLAERNISCLPTSSEERSSSNNNFSGENDSAKNYQTLKVIETTLTDESDRETKLKNTTLPEPEAALRRCQSFPRLASCRKIENINIVLPRKPSPLLTHSIEQDTGVFIDESMNFKQNFPEATDDSLFYGLSRSARKKASYLFNISQKFERDRHPEPFINPQIENFFNHSILDSTKNVNFNLPKGFRKVTPGNLSGLSQNFVRDKQPKMLEQSVASHMMSSTINTIATVDSDFDAHIGNLLAASTPLSSTHGLNVLAEKIEDRRETNEWVAQIRAMIINAPRLPDDRRKSQPPIEKKEAPSAFSSRLSNIMRIFRKNSPKNPKSHLRDQAGRSKRFSLDPQTMRRLNEQINKPIVLR